MFPWNLKNRNVRRKRVKEEIQIRINEKKINIIFSVKFGIKSFRVWMPKYLAKISQIQSYGMGLPEIKIVVNCYYFRNEL